MFCSGGRSLHRVYEWSGHDAKHCKNLFFRNHKGNRHYLVILDCDRDMDIHSIERLSFHPCVNTASLIVAKDDFLRFMDYAGNHYEWLTLYSDL
ncbi:MAG: hypothetical protein LBR18_03065 [Tannerella sp.]|nr:hypothetical protein [Tannerella sp.]